MKVYRYKLYTNAKRGELKELIYRFGVVRNYAVKIFHGYYKLTGKTLSAYQLSNHIAKAKKNPTRRTSKMVEGLPSQAVQECIARVHKGYRNFFAYCKRKKCGVEQHRKVRPPSVRKPSKNLSFTLLQAGYRFSETEPNKVKIGQKTYGFFKSQELKGKVKRLTIKRDGCGDIWFIVLTDRNDVHEIPMTGKAAGCDFGLKTFLTRHDGKQVEMPLFFKRNMKKLKALQQRLSLKEKGSHNRHKARLAVARLHRRIENQRNDWQWKVARSIVKEFDVICIEDLNLDGMKRLWGRKVSDYGFADFVAKLEYLAKKNGKEVRKMDRWLASSQTCHKCGYVNKGTKDLRVREWVCPQCGTHHDRDVNAAINILLAGTSACWRGSSKTKNSIEGLVA